MVFDESMASSNSSNPLTIQVIEATEATEATEVTEAIETDSMNINLPYNSNWPPRITLDEEIVDEPIQSTAVAKKSLSATGYDDSSEGSYNLIQIGLVLHSFMMVGHFFQIQNREVTLAFSRKSKE